jgi:hypothetical protein
MEPISISSISEGDIWQYEPKRDGLPLPGLQAISEWHPLLPSIVAEV